MATTTAFNDLTARDVMTEAVVTAHPSWTVERLADFFMEYDISGAPVTDDEGTLVGVVSMSDITQHSSLPGESLPRPQPHKRYHLGVDSEYSEEDLQSFREQEWGGATVDDIMTPMVFDVSEDAPLQTIADTMLKGRIHRVLVTRKKHLVGIITALDLIRVIRDL
jgi:CBS domain-containing protein